MKHSTMNLAPLLNAEIRRIARIEKKTDQASMDKLMDEIAGICGLKNRRMVYHWRSGHHALPAEHVPKLCQRFGSLVLLDALRSATAQIEIEIPDNFDLALQAARSVRQDLELYERLLLSFEDEEITPGELADLKELEARAHRNLHLMIGIAEADCARRQAIVAVSRKQNVQARIAGKDARAPKDLRKAVR